MILNARAGKPLPVYGKGDQIRDWLYVEDHATALCEVVRNGKVGETYNIGGHNEKQNLEVVHTICDLLEELAPEKPEGIDNYRDLITFVKDRPGHDIRYAIDASKIQNELGWTPSETFETGLRKTVQWFLANDDWIKNVTSGEYRNGLSIIMKHKVLLLGANGQVGWELRRCFSSLGHVSTVPRQMLDQSIFLDQGRKELTRMFESVKPTLVLNAAAYTAVDLAETEKESCLFLNSEIPSHLARLTKASDALYVDFSTDYVFDGTKSEPYDENDETHPINHYGLSKLEGLEAVVASGFATSFFESVGFTVRAATTFSKQC